MLEGGQVRVLPGGILENPPPLKCSIVQSCINDSGLPGSCVAEMTEVVDEVEAFFMFSVLEELIPVTRGSNMSFKSFEELPSFSGESLSRYPGRTGESGVGRLKAGVRLTTEIRELLFLESAGEPAIDFSSPRLSVTLPSDGDRQFTKGDLETCASNGSNCSTPSVSLSLDSNRISGVSCMLGCCK